MGINGKIPKFSSPSDFAEIGKAEAVITKVQNTVDGGFRITLDIPSEYIELASRLLKIAALPDAAVLVGFVEAS